MHNQAFMPDSPFVLSLHLSQEESDHCFDNSWNNQVSFWLALQNTEALSSLSSGKNVSWVVFQRLL